MGMGKSWLLLMGDRRQEIRRQEAGDRKQEKGDGRQETGNRKQETGDGRRETGKKEIGRS